MVVSIVFSNKFVANLFVVFDQVDFHYALIDRGGGLAVVFQIEKNAISIPASMESRASPAVMFLSGQGFEYEKRISLMQCE